MLFVLDRDGVINFESTAYIKTPEEWIPIPKSIEAIALLSKTGHCVVIATNQSGLARGLYTRETLQKIHQKMCDAVEALGGKIDGIYCCPHHPDDNCNCRKPKPGLLYHIQRDFHVKSNEMIFIGDSLCDFEAACVVGCKFILVKTGNGQTTQRVISASLNMPVFDNFFDAALFCCDNDNKNTHF